MRQFAFLIFTAGVLAAPAFAQFTQATPLAAIDGGWIRYTLSWQKPFLSWSQTFVSTYVYASLDGFLPHSLVRNPG